jgi:hypothetical protein
MDVRILPWLGGLALLSSCAAESRAARKTPPPPSAHREIPDAERQPAPPAGTVSRVGTRPPIAIRPQRNAVDDDVSAARSSEVATRAEVPSRSDAGPVASAAPGPGRDAPADRSPPPPPRTQGSPPSSPRLVNVASGKCLDAGPAPSRPGAPLQLWSCNDSDAQTFILRPIAGGGGRVRIVHVPSGLCVDVAPAASAFDVSRQQLGACSGTPTQSYSRGDRPGGFQLTNAQTRRCIDVDSGHDRDGARILQGDCRDARSEVWTLAGPAPAGSHDVETGLISSQSEAEQRCRIACAPPERWNGRWRVTVPGRLSVCGCSP